MPNTLESFIITEWWNLRLCSKHCIHLLHLESQLRVLFIFCLNSVSYNFHQYLKYITLHTFMHFPDNGSNRPELCGTLSTHTISLLTHSLIYHFETILNSKKVQTTTEMWQLKDFKIQIALKHCGKRWNCSCFPKAFFFNVLKQVYMEERVKMTKSDWTIKLWSLIHYHITWDK